MFRDLVLTWEEGRGDTITFRQQACRQERWEWHCTLIKRPVSVWESLLNDGKDHTSSDALWLVPWNPFQKEAESQRPKMRNIFLSGLNLLEGPLWFMMPPETMLVSGAIITQDGDWKGKLI